MQFEDFFYDEIRLPSVNHFMLITDGFVTEISKALFTPQDEMLNEEVHKTNLIRATKSYAPPNRSGIARIDRSINTRLMNFSVKPADESRYGRDYQHLEFTALADPSVEGTSHYGYVIFNNPRQSVKELFCSCNDFFFRSYYVFVKNNLATFKLDPDTMKILNTKFADRQKVLTMLKPSRSIKHTEAESLKSNPRQQMFLCKHLYRAITEFMKYRKPVPMKLEPPVAKKEIPINKIKGVEKEPEVKKTTVEPEVKKVSTMNRQDFRKKTADAAAAIGAIKEPTPAKSAVKPTEREVVKQPAATKPAAKPITKPLDQKSKEEFRQRTLNAIKNKSFK